MLIVPTFNTAEGNFDPIRRYLPGTTMRMLDLEVGAGERYIAAVAEEIQKQGTTVSWEVSRGDPSKQIVKATRETPCDLLILATHGNEGFNAFWTGSVAHRICSYTDIPVLLVPVQRGEPGTEPPES